MKLICSFLVFLIANNCLAQQNEYNFWQNKMKNSIYLKEFMKLSVEAESRIRNNYYGNDLKKVEDLMRSHIKGDYPLVVETSRHLVEAGGKRLRPLLTLLSAQFGDPTNYDIIKAAVCCELTHLATLYHDDVMDDAALRRGVISANKKWDNAVAILTGDYLFSKVSDMLADIGPEAVKLQAKTFERLVIGQIKETQGKSEGLSQIDHYMKVVADKTGLYHCSNSKQAASITCNFIGYIFA